MCTALIPIHHSEHWLIPILFRILIILGVSVFHLLYHKFGEHIIHITTKKHKLTWKYLPDVIMVAALIVLHLVESGMEPSE
jgi:hypothetical protein